MGEPEGFYGLVKLDWDTLYNKCRYRKIPVSTHDTKAYMARELAKYELATTALIHPASTASRYEPTKDPLRNALDMFLTNFVYVQKATRSMRANAKDETHCVWDANGGLGCPS